MNKIGYLVRPKFGSITADEIGANSCGIIIDYNDILCQPHLVLWTGGRNNENKYVWEYFEDLLILSEA